MKVTHNGKEFEVDTTNDSAISFARKYAINYAITYNYQTDLKTLCGILVDLYESFDDEDKKEFEEIISAVKPIQ